MIYAPYILFSIAAIVFVAWCMFDDGGPSDPIYA
jgi:hypothetical protein